MSSRLATREALFDVMEQIAEERIAARPIVEELLSRGDEVWDEEIPESWRTAGFVQELTAAGAAIVETNPKKSLSLAQLALTVATTVPPDTYPTLVQAFIEGNVWRDIGFAHRYPSAYEAALRAYEAAYRTFSRECALAYEQARAQFGRATVFLFTRRDDDALEILERTADVFHEFGDEKSVLNCEISQATVHFFRGNVQSATVKYLEFIERLKEFAPDDLYTFGLLYGNVGHFLTMLGRNGEAFTALQRAREIFTLLGMPSEVDRAEWGLAIILLSSGDFETALPLLRNVREAHLKRGLPENAGLIALYIVDALVATDRRTEALELVERVLGEFVNANLNQHAITALGYLRDLLPVAIKPRETVNDVRAYVERLRNDRTSRFLLPESQE